MYERMLDKHVMPTLLEMTTYCKETAEVFTSLNEWITRTYDTQQEITFPYGNKYGWCITHRRKKKMICHLFAEDNAFTVMIRLSDNQFASIYDDVSDYTKAYIDNKYPCSAGGWIHYRITNEEQSEDIIKLINAKLS